MVRTQIKREDSLMIKLSDVEPKNGLSAMDYCSITPGKCISRAREMGGIVTEASLSRNHDELLCQGAALGDAGGTVTHLAQGQRGFAGFCIGNELGDKVRVLRRCRVFLPIEDGVTDRDRGKTVYSAPSPNGPFSLQHFEGAYAIGKVRFAESPTVAAVAIRAHNATGPDDLALGH